MKVLFSVLSMLCFLSVAMGQDKHTISGYVTDGSTGEALIGAYILDTKSEKIATTNVYGFYSLTLPSDSVDLVSSYIGYVPRISSFYLDENINLDFKLGATIELAEAVVESTQSEPIQDQTQMSSIELDMKMVKNLPVLLGETDLLKTIQLLPGVQSGTEGASGIYVRGGGPDQNLILLDGVPVYNASHLFGFFSVFNADAIRDVELIKGGFPARYGGRLSSVIDVRMKEGNLNETHGEVSVGIISAKATVEGPIKKGKSSFLISGRRTYIDLLARPIIRRAARQNGETGSGGYFFYDFNAKLNYIINDKNRVFLSGYFGNDKAFIKYDSNFGNGTEEFDTRLVWGNAIVAARWNHIFSPKLFSNTTLTYSRYRLFTSIGLNSTFDDGIEQSTTFRYDSGIDDLTAKVDFDFIPSPNANVKFGTSYINHTFTPGVNELDLDIDDLQLDTIFGSDRILAHEVNFYTEVDWKVSDKLKMNLGLHSSNFFVEGQQYLSLQPRVAMRYMLNKKSSIKAAYSNMTQFLHLLTTSSIGLPTDLWVPVTERIKPQISDQVALGYAMTPIKGYQVSLEGYYKWMKNLIEYKDGANFQGTAENWQDKVETGIGWSYGAELLLEKTSGPVTGWIGYTLSWTDRQFENINFGEKFPYRFDRRHDFSLALTYKKNDRVDCGFVYVYGTGNAVTLPVARHQGLSSAPTVSGNGFFSPQLDHITQRNGYRMPSYHRLDIGINFHKEKDNGTRTWSLGIYNAYNRQNPFFLFFDQENGESVLKQASLFPLLPSISYGFKF